MMGSAAPNPAAPTPPMAVDAVDAVDAGDVVLVVDVLDTRRVAVADLRYGGTQGKSRRSRIGP